MAGSFIYVNCPAISHGEWHPFSIIQVPGTGLTAAFYAEVVSSCALMIIQSKSANDDGTESFPCQPTGMLNRVIPDRESK